MLTLQQQLQQYEQLKIERTKEIETINLKYENKISVFEKDRVFKCFFE